MRRFALMLILLAGSAQAQSWQLMDADAIRAALTDRVFVYPAGEVQEFYASGRTLYTTSRPSWGYWEVRGNRYCSQWPPSDLWACYLVARRSDNIRFIGEGGDTYDAAPQE